MTRTKQAEVINDYIAKGYRMYYIGPTGVAFMRIGMCNDVRIDQDGNVS